MNVVGVTGSLEAPDWEIPDREMPSADIDMV
jgi:hypothetical protein